MIPNSSPPSLNFHHFDSPFLLFPISPRLPQPRFSHHLFPPSVNFNSPTASISPPLPCPSLNRSSSPPFPRLLFDYKSPTNLDSPHYLFHPLFNLNSPAASISPQPLPPISQPQLPHSLDSTTINFSSWQSPPGENSLAESTKQPQKH